MLAKSPISWLPTSTPKSASRPAPLLPPGPSGASTTGSPATVCAAPSPRWWASSAGWGADLNPYLAFAALLAAGLDGVENSLELEKPFSGDAYKGRRLREIPKTLREACDLMNRSRMLCQALGDGVVDHLRSGDRLSSAGQRTDRAWKPNCRCAQRY
jgi:hypothetical protein